MKVWEAIDILQGLDPNAVICDYNPEYGFYEEICCIDEYPILDGNNRIPGGYIAHEVAKRCKNVVHLGSSSNKRDD